MAVDGSLNFDTKIDTKGFNGGIKNINNTLGGLKSALGKVALAVGAAFSVKAIVDFGKQAVETASDMAEVQNVVDTAFGSMSSKMEKFADTSIKQFGISKLAAKQTGSTFMAMASGMGIAQDNASDMAIALTGLSADMASFYNVEQDVASTALKSIFTGETETLKQFGIVMTDANLQAFALSQGINKQTSEMSQAEKVQLRYAYVMQQTSLAQGDFAKTADSWANQTRILSEQWKEFRSVIGSALIGVILPAVKAINDLLSKLISYATAAVNALSNVFDIKLNGDDVTSGMAANTSQIADTSATAADNYSDMAAAAEKAQKSNEKSLASFDKINKLGDSTKDTTSSSTAVAAPSLSGAQGKISVKAEVETSDAEKKITDFLNKFKSAMASFFAPLKSAWDTHGTAVIASLNNAFNGISGLIKSIGSSFKTVWNNGTGEKTVGHLLGIFTGINNTIGNISKSFATAWNTDNIGTDIIQDLANILNIVLGHIENIAKKTADWAKTLDFTPLLKAFDSLLKAVAPFADDIGKGLEWFWDNVLLPLASFTITDVIPKFLEALGAAIDVLRAAVEALKPLGKWLWDSFLQPIASWTGGVISSALSGITNALKGISDWISQHQTAVESFVVVVVSLGTALKISAIIQAAIASLTAMGGVMGIAAAATTALGTAVAFLTSPITLVTLAIGAIVAAGVLLVRHWEEVKEFAGTVWEGIKNVFAGIGNWFKSKFLSAVNNIKAVFTPVGAFFKQIWQTIKLTFAVVGSWFKSIFSKAWNGIKAVFSGVKTFFSGVWAGIKSAFSTVVSVFKTIFTNAWNGIKSVFGGVKTFFSGIVTNIKNIFSGIITFITSIFKGKWQSAWGAVKKIFKNVWDGFVNIAKAPINLIIGLINGLTGAVEKALNWIVDGVNKLSFDVPDWVPGIGGKKFGFNIPKVDIPEIPKLAQGAVIPPNSEFLAVLGDQKRGTNIEAPLATIKQAVAEVMGNQSPDKPIVVVLNLDGKQVYKTVVNENRRQTNATGVNQLIY